MGIDREEEEIMLINNQINKWNKSRYAFSVPAYSWNSKTCSFFQKFNGFLLIAI
jgi:hypothetical protein